MSCSIIQQHLKEHTMLYFNFKLSNPFKVKERGQRNFVEWDRTVFGFGFVLNLYDIRHWNYDTDSWEQYPGEAWNDDEIVG